MNHTIATAAYRFDAGGRSIVVSGDLTYSALLSKLAKGADYLIIDSGGTIKFGQRAGGQGQGGRPGAGATTSVIANRAVRERAASLGSAHMSPWRKPHEWHPKPV